MLRIKLDKLSKKYIREWIIRDCSCQFESGQSYAVTGPNGSGKSTLAKIVCGYTSPTSGTITFSNDNEKIDVEELYKVLAFASPHMELVEEFTLEEMLKFHGKFKRTINGISEKDLPELMLLEKARNKQIRNFSSGMKQRLKLGLALFYDCRLMLLDEPTTNLDEGGVEWFLNKVKETGEDKVIIVCSNLEREYEFCDHKLNMMDWK